jgi:HSF-type DNA-binding
MRTSNGKIASIEIKVVLAHDAPLRTVSIITFQEKVGEQNVLPPCSRTLLRTQLCAMRAHTLPATMSNNTDGDDPSNRQERETLELLTRLLLLQSTTSDQQQQQNHRDSSRVANLSLLRQLETALGLSSDSANRASQHSLGGSLPASIQPLQAQLLLDSLLRTGTPSLPGPHNVPQPNAAMALGLPAATINSVLSACLPQKQAQPPPDLGLQQLALLMRQYQTTTPQLPQPVNTPALNMNPAALIAALNTLAALQTTQPANQPPLAPAPFAVLPGLGVVPPTGIQGLGGMAPITLTHHPMASSRSTADIQEAEERPSSTHSEPSSRSRREKKEGIKNEAFPLKLYRLLKESEEAGKDDIVSFTHTGNAFKIHHQQRFANEILPDYFRHKRFDSFKRQLSMYGFVRIPVGPEEGAFEHRLFKRDRLDLIQQMRRVAVEQGAASGSPAEATGNPPSQAGGIGAAESDSHVPAYGPPATSSTASEPSSSKPRPTGV